METMKAAQFRGQECIEVLRIPIPEVKPGTLLVKVQSCAICGSDLRTFFHGNPRVKTPKILGHEISGVVVAIGEGVTSYKEGDNVTVGADIPCGQCFYCKNHRANCCETNLAIGYQFEGGFSEYILLDPLVVNGGPLKKFSKGLSFDLAALAEPLACCINGYEIGLFSKGKSVLIFGAGPIGQMLAQLGQFFEASLIVVLDPVQNRLDTLKQHLPKVFTMNSKEASPKKLKTLNFGRGFDLIFTACPEVEVHGQVLDYIGKNGVVNFFGGLPKSTPPVPISTNFIHYNEIYLTGSHGSTPKQHREALQLIEDNQIDLSYLITSNFNLDRIQEAFTQAISKKDLKVLINPFH